MTRIHSYDFLACDKCGQIHLKANYASISNSIPADALLTHKDIKTCFKCGDKKPFKDFRYLKTELKPARISNPFFLHTIKKFFFKLLNLKLPNEDFRGLYPPI